MKKLKINLWIILLGTYLIQGMLEWLRIQNSVSEVSKAYLSKGAILELACAFLIAVAMERAIDLYRKSKKLDKEAIAKSNLLRSRIQEKYMLENSEET